MKAFLLFLYWIYNIGLVYKVVVVRSPWSGTGQPRADCPWWFRSVVVHDELVRSCTGVASSLAWQMGFISCFCIYIRIPVAPFPGVCWSMHKVRDRGHPWRLLLVLFVRLGLLFWFCFLVFLSLCINSVVRALRLVGQSMRPHSPDHGVFPPRQNWPYL